MATIPEQRTGRFQRLITTYWPKSGASGTASTFDLYRRVRSAAPNYLGVPTDGWQNLYPATPCTLVGVKRLNEGGFEVVEQGQVQRPMLEIHTALQDVVAGDELILAQDGKAYHVSRVSFEGGVNYLLCDHAKAQIKGPNG